jgi:hypothetical protein
VGSASRHFIGGRTDPPTPAPTSTKASQSPATPTIAHEPLAKRASTLIDSAGATTAPPHPQTKSQAPNRPAHAGGGLTDVHNDVPRRRPRPGPRRTPHPLTRSPSHPTPPPTLTLTPQPPPPTTSSARYPAHS